MVLLKADQAIIEPEKLRGYLLSPTHPIGRFKAAFFARLGYRAERWSQLEQDLRKQHLSKEAEEIGQARYGKKYRICGPLIGPNGKQADVVSIWIIRKGEAVPRFVTAYPKGG